MGRVLLAIQGMANRDRPRNFFRGIREAFCGSMRQGSWARIMQRLVTQVRDSDFEYSY